MNIQPMPPAEVVIDVRLVKRLLREQHAEMASLAIVEAGEGWDNKLFRLGEDLVVRLPRRRAAATLIEHETRWLPVIAPNLPLPVPVPVRVGGPGCGFPWAWVVARWFPGAPAATTAQEPIIDREEIELGVFHQEPGVGADEKLTTALLDRLAHHATVITTKGKSYRMRKRRGPEPPA